MTTSDKTDPSLASGPTKPGYKTLGFYAALLLTSLGALTASGSDVAGWGPIGFVMASLGAAGYTAFRAFKKSEDPKKPAWKTTEFYLSVASALVAVIYASGLFTEASTVGQVVAFVASALAMLGYSVKPKR